MLSAGDMRRFCDRIEHRRVRKNHEHLHRAGAALGALYVINSGFVKTIISDGNGHEQITGFSMPGDLVGLDAIATGKHQCSTIALEDSSLCGMAFADLEQLNREDQALQLRGVGRRERARRRDRRSRNAELRRKRKPYTRHRSGPAARAAENKAAGECSAPPAGPRISPS
jgi:CRP-like cAMP-binding protein